jgi:hypothetical protein
MKLLSNAQCLEYRCEHCGFDWCAVDEASDTDSCPNCGTPDVAPCHLHSLHPVATAEGARP